MQSRFGHPRRGCLSVLDSPTTIHLCDPCWHQPRSRLWLPQPRPVSGHHGRFWGSPPVTMGCRRRPEELHRLVILDPSVSDRPTAR
ncbi:hypothetical protein ACFPRL_18025 [Pseudoclavibacter helvolus]